MTSDAPSWVELMGRHAANSMLFMSGTMTYRYVTRDGRVEEGVWNFWRGPGQRWRIERDARPILIRSDDVSFSWIDDEMHRSTGHFHLHIVKPVSPIDFIGSETLLSPSHLSEETRPTVLPVATSAIGRRAWTITMTTPADSEPFDVVIDDATGAILRASSDGGPLQAELTHLDVHDNLADSLFDWDGPVAAPSRRERHRDSERQRLIEEMATGSTPRFWPTGVASTPIAGDPDTGELVLSLLAGDSAILARWPASLEPTLLDDGLTEHYSHSYDWSNEQWSWRLLSPEPIDPDDLERIQQSMPPPPWIHFDS